MWPGLEKSVDFAFGSIAFFIVADLSCAEIPVVVPSFASIETVNAVSCRSVLF